MDMLPFAAEPTSRSIHEELNSPAPLQKFKEGRKRFQSIIPVLHIDAEGQLLDLNAPARRLLEYEATDNMESYFFAYVHGKNLNQVMRDVAHMVQRGKKRASWMLRLRTGKGHWRWYKAIAKNRLQTAKSAITIYLRDLYQW